MEVHRVPLLENYWSSDLLLCVPGIVHGMPIDRFKVILRCIHRNDNNTIKSRNDPQDYQRTKFVLC